MMSAEISEGSNKTMDRSAVLFAFDDVSMPWRYAVRLQMHRPEKYAGNPILARGETGEIDACRLQCCPVIREGDRFRMWYVARDDDPDLVRSYDAGRICYAESADGFHWTKPNLKLVDYKGSTKNNICDIEPGAGNMDVLYDPDGPPERRYLMVIEFMGWRHRKEVHTVGGPSITRFAASPDGFRWTMLQDEPGVLRQHHESFCLYRFGGCYHVAGHIAPPMAYAPLQKHGHIWMAGPKMLVVWRSPDVDSWPPEACLAFFKPMQSSSPYRPGWDREDVHLGAYVTPYPNVCLGIVGQWHHPITDAPPENPDYIAEEVSVDLGLIVSNDGVHFRKPAPGFTFIGRDQELSWDRDWKDNTANDHLLLLQGPIINIGDQTVIYYTAFTPTGDKMEGKSNLGLATLPKERFGSLTPVPDIASGQVVTCPLTTRAGAVLYANFEVEAGGSLQVALTDVDALTELPGYEMESNAGLFESAFERRVVWRSRDVLPEGTFRIRVRLNGSCRFYALYVDEPKPYQGKGQ
jgi:hypothetical protein